MFESKIHELSDKDFKVSDSVLYFYINVLSPFQIVGRFNFSRYIIFRMYLDIVYI
jgi:hypothetical protein